MRVVVQRVREASVYVEQKGEVGSIGQGILVLVGIHRDDTETELNWLCNKILDLRIFDDEEGKMNLSVRDVKGEILVVSQFTLYGDASKGNRPSYMEAADPAKAKELYDRMVDQLEDMSELTVESGVFGAYMDVSLLNDGPVTIIIDR